MWISDLAILFGAGLDSEIERARELDEEREGAATRLQLQPRQEPNGRKP